MRIDLPCCDFKNCMFQFDGNCMDKANYEKCEYEEIIQKIHDVPDTNVEDTISRRAAIDYFVRNVGWHDEDGYQVEDAEELRKIWTDIFNGVSSEQSEKRTDKHTETHECDYISRQAAIDAHDKRFDSIPMEQTTEIMLLRRDLRSLPPAQQWIPVSSGKMPDDLQEVNITWVNHRLESYYEHIKDKPFNGSAVYYKGRWYWYSQYCVDELKDYGDYECDEMDDAIEVIAWMPLPEPWKGENND